MLPPEGEVMPICLHMHKLWGGGSERVILWREGVGGSLLSGDPQNALNLSPEKISLMKMRIKLGTQETRSLGGIQSQGDKGAETSHL